MAMTVMEVLERSVKKYPANIAHRYKVDGTWQENTWQDYYQTVRRFARGLGAIGVQHKDAVGILSYNCKEWVYADVASIFVGAIPAGIYPTSSADQCVYILNHSKATCVVVEDKKQLDKILSVRSQLKYLHSIILMKGHSPEQGVYTWDKILLKAEEFSETELNKRIALQNPKDLATLVYTSGTTSNPKAVMLSHDNLTWMSQVCVQFDLKLSIKDHLISYLPLSHIAEQMTTIHGPMYAGTCVSFAESMEKFAENLREVRPTLFLGVPRVWEKIQEKMMEKGRNATFVQKQIAKWAKSVGLRYGHDLNPNAEWTYRLANKLVYTKVRKALGLDRCRMQVTAAAPISKETLDFFLSLGIPIYELYGMSESTGPATISYPGQFRLGSAGVCIKGGEVKIADDGEILIRGRHVFMGYLEDPVATREILDADGWLHSGDIGTLDEDGFIFITGRKKNLIITAGGENIAPEMIENKLKSIPEVEQAVIVGDRRKFLTALLTLSPEALKTLKSRNFPTTAKNVDELCKCDSFYEYLHDCIEEINGTVARVQTVKNFKILPQSFSEETGELTPTMKVKRGVVMKKYAQEIEAMY